MSDPLQIFEKHPDVDAYRFGPSFTPYAIVAKEKRFTAAELAAEYWLGLNEKQGSYGLNRPLTWDQLDTLLDFATLPHYDEQ